MKTHDKNLKFDVVFRGVVDLLFQIHLIKPEIQDKF